MWQPSSYAAASPSPSQRRQQRTAHHGVGGSTGGTPVKKKNNNNENNNERVLSMRLALEEALTNVDAFWDTQMTAYNLKVERSKSAMVARHAEERQELKHKLAGGRVYSHAKGYAPQLVHCFISSLSPPTADRVKHAFASVEP